MEEMTALELVDKDIKRRKNLWIFLAASALLEAIN
jgi:hypothetical protein